MFSKILIANRGEIALRVMRACKEMGIKTVAIYSEADRNARHTRYADEAYYVGPAPSAQSYLRMEAIVEIALKTGAQAIHPGYGFLSENAKFSALVEHAGLTFIGPLAHSIETMGSKIGAKQAVKNFGVPMVPGTDTAIADVSEARSIAVGIGFPVLIKASAGGGGKGMRVVEKEADFDAAVQGAMSEAQASFGDASVFIEKYVAAPRHIEFQVLADHYGNTVHLFERECSIQRRHQKLVEEAPSCVLTPELRKRMGDAAVNAAKACQYRGAGTIEFLLDENLNFYFLEMNTRLQVEHPVTEQITGVDLVKAQLRIASGEKLWFSQEDLTINGHSIELRVCAEDPENNFLPDVGTITHYEIPQGYGVRVDDCMEPFMEIPIYYDPMVAKLIVHAETRELAMDKMKQAIDDYRISGIKTTLPFGTYVMNHAAFREGKFDTGFIGRYFTPDQLVVQDSIPEALWGLAALAFFEEKSPAGTTVPDARETISAWKRNRTKLRG